MIGDLVAAVEPAGEKLKKGVGEDYCIESPEEWQIAGKQKAHATWLHGLGMNGGGGARRNQVQSTPRKPNTPFTISKLEPGIVQSILITYYHCACLVAYCVAYSILKEVP